MASLRQILRKIPPLFWSVGAYRLMQFKRALKREDAAYVAAGDSTFPPPMLRYRVHRALDLDSYVNVGQQVAGALLSTLSFCQVPMENAKVLDFASGPGRVAYWMKKWQSSFDITASDIDAEAIGWAREHIPTVADFRVNDMAPPLAFADDTFDIIYSVSLFTHLDEVMQDQWLAELARVLKPGGVLITTVHGTAAQTSCTPDELERIHRKGIYFRRDHSGMLKLDGLPDFYQTTFHTAAYVREHWGEFLRVEKVIEGGLGGHHDIVVLRKTPHFTQTT